MKLPLKKRNATVAIRVDPVLKQTWCRPNWYVVERTALYFISQSIDERVDGDGFYSEEGSSSVCPMKQGTIYYVVGK